MTAITLIPADAVPAEQLHASFRAAFADYLIGPFEIPLAQWPTLLARQGIDLGLSRAAMRGDELLAFAFAAPRERRWRLGTMGAVPAARGSGAAPMLLDDFMARAAAAGMAEVELEVFAQNERARRLYEGRGFSVLHELHGYDAPPLGGEPRITLEPLEPVGREQAFAWFEGLDLPDLPLQVTPRAMGASPSVLQALRIGKAQIVYAESSPEQIGVASLIDADPAQADARSLVQALRERYAERRISVPALQRLDVGGQALRDCGFVPQPLHQLLMRAESAA